MIKIKTPIISLLSLILFFTTACKNKRVFEDYKVIRKAGWHKDSIAEFKFDIEQPQSSYNVSVNVRNLGNYPYSNLWLFVDIVAPDSTILRDTVEFQLARNDGKWLGKGIGDLYDNNFIYKSNVFFPTKGTYTVQLEQAMRNDILKGIHDIGISVKKIKR